MLVPVNHDVCYNALQLVFVCACNWEFFTCFFRRGCGGGGVVLCHNAYHSSNI